MTERRATTEHRATSEGRVTTERWVTMAALRLDQAMPGHSTDECKLTCNVQ